MYEEQSPNFPLHDTNAFYKAEGIMCQRQRNEGGGGHWLP